MYSAKQGKFLLENARKAIELYLDKKIIYKIKSSEKWLNEKRGIFVTLNTYPEKELRGCIGFPEPLYPLKEAIVKAALSAAFEDPRFPKVSIEELDKIVIEVSILTEPKLIEHKNPEELLKKIEPFKDGLILKRGNSSGLFLPQVWKQLPEKEDFLLNLCFKAGIPNPEAWKDKDTEIYKFNVEIFVEEKQNIKT